MDDALDLLVRKHDLRQTRFAPGVVSREAELAAGQILVRVDRFALTANNVTYGAIGEQLGYWKFFPTDDPEWGRLPVWGFGDVVRSSRDDVQVGERLYGYFPISTHVLLEPSHVTPRSLTDGAPHRAALPGIYNRYVRVDADPACDRAHEPALAIFRPLFGTSWLLDDFLAEQSHFGAKTIVLASASSKTALGLAQLSKTRGSCRVAGLTAPARVPFVRSTGYYDDVLSYDDIASLPSTDTVYVDFSGDATVRAAVYTQLGERLRYSSRVGMTHWERLAAPAELRGGPAPVFFFAPEQARKRSAEWGPGELEGRIAAALAGFLASASAWLRIVESRGPAAVEATYRALLEGTADPAEGHVLGL